MLTCFILNAYCTLLRSTVKYFYALLLSSRNKPVIKLMRRILSEEFRAGMGNRIVSCTIYLRHEIRKLILRITDFFLSFLTQLLYYYEIYNINFWWAFLKKRNALLFLSRTYRATGNVTFATPLTHPHSHARCTYMRSALVKRQSVTLDFRFRSP